jgi:hypothetical protein
VLIGRLARFIDLISAMANARRRHAPQNRDCSREPTSDKTDYLQKINNRLY